MKPAAVRQQTLKVLGDAAYYNFRWQLQEFDRALREQAKAGYNPNQPRVPAGNPDGGQWAGGGGSGSARDSSTSAQNVTPYPDAIEPVYPELAIVPMLRIPRLAAAWRAWALQRNASRNWEMGSHKTSLQWRNRLEKGNWTPEKISRTIRYGKPYRAPNKPNPSRTATGYELDGNYVVVDDKTKEIIQVSEPHYIPEKLP